MKDFSKIDKNFEVVTEFDTSNITFYDVCEAPFQVHGLLTPTEGTERFCRIPKAVAERVSECVLALHANSAGGRVRFRTNSKRIAIMAKEGAIEAFPHFAMTGSCGFDLYVENRYVNTFKPPADNAEGYSSIIELPETLFLDSSRETSDGISDVKSMEVSEDNKLLDITINFPLYTDVISLAVGVEKGARVEEPLPYKHEKPVVYYGSSITQGGCASRPGNAYESIISRRLDCDFINLGFSGSAKGEREMAEYIADLAMEAFVCDYDYNADTIEELRATHSVFVEVIRQKQPNLPIIFVTKPQFYNDIDTEQRVEIIRGTYEALLQKGDQNIYLIDGGEMMRRHCDDCGTVDGVHPNDHGFVAMAKGIGDVLEEILETKR